MKAKFIYEKFTDESDPIKDMGIGIYTERNFKTMNDAHKFLYDILPGFLKIQKPKQVIAHDDEYILVHEYYIKIYKYWYKYVRVNNKYYSFDADEFKTYIKKRLKNKIKENVNEKFTDESNPIKDLGIGINHKRNFETIEELTEWIFKYLPHILETDKIPYDIIQDDRNWLKEEYIMKIEEYCKKYLSYMNNRHEIYWRYLHNLLENQGYKG
jgi:hypothetical protein